ncbi:MAG: cyclic pyranopterin monophosphate synthase [Gammaproteobacteria bacterium]|nr:cyclic pyranopterin monophosphate synthase [Gammaproteobacteria bacterium]
MRARTGVPAGLANPRTATACVTARPYPCTLGYIALGSPYLRRRIGIRRGTVVNPVQIMAKPEVVVPLSKLHSPRDTLARPVRDLRISVMDRCNFRCPYCMPREKYHERYKFLGSHERLSFDEIVRLSRLFVRLGVRKLRLTGGEPLLRTNLSDLVGDLTAIPGVEDVALTTNGVLLSRHAAELKAAGLKRITVSLDSLDPEVFARMSGGFGGLADVLDGIEHARSAGLDPIKINAVIQRGLNDHTALDLVERFRGTGVIVRFIEYMDVGNRNDWRPDIVVPSKELVARIAERWPLRPLEREYRGDVAERYDFVDGAGEVGFISSVTQPFCGDCSRARLSSDGVIYTCLFATKGTSLRDALRGGATDDELLETIRNVWLARADRYSEKRAELRQAPGDHRKVEMFYIGG